jgi:hypothetical protein
MNEKPPNNDKGEVTYIEDFKERRRAREEKLADSEKPGKKIGRLKAKPENMSANRENNEGENKRSLEEALSVIAKFHFEFIPYLNGRIGEIKKNLAEKKEYIFWINAINLLEEIEIQEREFINVRKKIENIPGEKALPEIIKGYLDDLTICHFNDLETRAKTGRDASFLMQKLEKFLEKNIGKKTPTE